MSKPPRPYMHILVVAEPLLAFQQLVMRCGKVLETALIVYNFNTDFRAEIQRPNTEKRCPVCEARRDEIHAAFADLSIASEIPMYEYGLVEKKEWQAYLEARGKETDEAEVA